jgi:hypothetical protein
MNRLLFMAVVAMVFLSGMAASDGPKGTSPPGPTGAWEEFKSVEGRFTATFPGHPQVSSKKSAAGNVTTKIEFNSDRINCAVSYTDYRNADPKTNPKFMLKTLVDGFGKDVQNKKDIKLNGHDGVELVLAQGDRKDAIIYRGFYVNGRLFQVLASAVPGDKGKADVLKFLDSFQLHEAKKDEEIKKGDKK